METERLKQIKVHGNAISELLYEETESGKVKTLEGIEVAVRKHLIDYVNPEIANFLYYQMYVWMWGQIKGNQLINKFT